MKTRQLQLSLYISFILICQFAYSQSPMGIIPMNRNNPVLLDNAEYAIIYKMSFITDVSKPQEVKTGEYALLIGRNYSKFFNQWYLDNPVSESKASQSRGGGAPNMDGQGMAGTEIFKNISEQTILVTTILSGSRKAVYQYAENIPVMAWKIENEQKMIQGYMCKKATTRFLGRDYVAWFAPAIPLSNGPWKFSGLPGLILQVSDTKNHYVFEAVKIEGQLPQMSYMPGEENTQPQTTLETIRTQQHNINIPIVKYDVEYRDITRQSLNELIELSHRDIVEFLTSNGNIMVEGSERVPPIPYNPIELE